MHKLHKNQETRIMTKFGLTDTIVIEDNIRQGRTTDLGLSTDGIALLARSAIELQGILNITNIFLNEWHLKVSIKKSAVTIFRNNINRTYNNQFRIYKNKKR